MQMSTWERIERPGGLPTGFPLAAALRLLTGPVGFFFGMGWWAVGIVAVLAVWTVVSWVLRLVASESRQPVVVALVLWLLYRRAEERRATRW